MVDSAHLSGGLVTEVINSFTDSHTLSVTGFSGKLICAIFLAKELDQAVKSQFIRHPCTHIMVFAEGQSSCSA